MGSESRSRVKVSVPPRARARAECKQKVLNRSNVIAAKNYNSEERRSSLRVPGVLRTGGESGETQTCKRVMCHERHLRNSLRFVTSAD